MKTCIEGSRLSRAIRSPSQPELAVRGKPMEIGDAVRKGMVEGGTSTTVPSEPEPSAYQEARKRPSMTITTETVSIHAYFGQETPKTKRLRDDTLEDSFYRAIKELQALASSDNDIQRSLLSKSKETSLDYAANEFSKTFVNAQTEKQPRRDEFSFLDSKSHGLKQTSAAARKPKPLMQKALATYRKRISSGRAHIPWC